VLAAEALLDGEAAALTRKAIEKAKEGDTVALRLCLERILPPRKDRPVQIELPKLTSAADATNALALVAAKVAEGEVTPDEGASINGVIGGYLKAVEITDIERRLAELERGKPAMGSRFETRLKKLEAMKGDDVDSILDGLSYEQRQAFFILLMALLEGVEEPSDERLRQSPMNRARYEQELASIPEGVFERLLAAFIDRVARKEAA
jgi:hypothetical protein